MALLYYNRGTALHYKLDSRYGIDILKRVKTTLFEGSYKQGNLSGGAAGRRGGGGVAGLGWCGGVTR